MDAREAFDDVLGGDKNDEIIDMMGETLRVLRRRRLRIPRPWVEIIGYDPTAFTFEPSHEILGADADVDAGEYPLFEKIKKRFSQAIGKPKLVRLDDEQSYADFRNARRQSHIEDLDKRLSKLEQAFAAHTSDGHGGVFDDVVHTIPNTPDYEQAVIGAIKDTQRGGKPVDLGLPYHMHGKVECWRDGDEVLVSARTPWGIATTGEAIDRHFEEVVGCAEAVGCCGLEVLLVGAELAPQVAGAWLLHDLFRISGDLANAEPFVGVIMPNADPGKAAMLALLQKCQRGDKQACREAHKMLHGKANSFVRKTGDLLTLLQAKKKHVLGMDGKEFGINFFGGAHTGGNILLHAFGAGALGDKLTELEAPALPGWAGGTADAPMGPPPPPPPVPKAAQAITIVNAPDTVSLVHNNDSIETIVMPTGVAVLNGKRFDGNGYKNKKDQTKFSFGFDKPTSVTVNLKNNKKNTISDVKVVMFQGGKEQGMVV